ncbi:hypothetical protein BKA63DRAFT_521659 [Paraphoma chrysanthemicola]|nr:hypothetical protein BKA63DRAFT_521659 [Paraphoma chrysanthemicola]
MLINSCRCRRAHVCTFANVGTLLSCNWLIVGVLISAHSCRGTHVGVLMSGNSLLLRTFLNVRMLMFHTFANVPYFRYCQGASVEHPTSSLVQQPIRSQTAPPCFAASLPSRVKKVRATSISKDSCMFRNTTVS